MNLKEPQQDLLTFGIWANYYSSVKNTHNLDTLTRELQKPVRNSAFSLQSNFNNIIRLFLLGLLIFSINNF